MLCDSATAVAIAITSRENSDSSMPGWPCVTPSHIAGTPPATCAVAPASRAASLMMLGKALVGLMRRQHVVVGGDDGQVRPLQALSASLSCVAQAAKPCARFEQDSFARVALASRAARARAR